MNILFLNTDQNWSNYAEQNMILASILKKRGHQVFIALKSDSQLNKQAWMRSLEIIPIKSMFGLKPLAKAKLTKFIKKNNIDLVHIFNTKAIPLGLKISKKAKICSPIITHHPGFPKKLSFFIKRHYHKQLFSIIVSSGYIKNILADQRIGVNDIYILPEGVDLLRYQDTLPFFDDFYTEFSVPPEFFLIGFQSPGQKKEDVTFLLNIVEKVCRFKSNVIFLLIGSPVKRSFLEHQIQQRKLTEKLINIGDRDNMPNILSVINMMVVPFDKEDYRCLILKTMAMAKPVIATDYQGVKEIIQQEKTGIIVSNKDTYSLSKYVISLANNKNKITTLGTNARKEVERSFDMQLLAEKMEQIYQDRLNRS